MTRIHGIFVRCNWKRKAKALAILKGFDTKLVALESPIYRSGHYIKREDSSVK